MPAEPILATTRASGVADSPNLEKNLWAPGFGRFADQKDQLAKYEGAEGSESGVHTKRDLTTQTGHAIKFNNMSALRGRVRVGEQRQNGNEQQLKPSGYSVSLDYRRGSVAWNRAFSETLATGGRKAVQKLVIKLLGEQNGLNKQRDALLRLRNAGNIYGHGTGNGANHIYAGGASTIDELDSSDELSTGTLSDMKLKATNVGVNPMSIKRAGSSYGGDIHKHVVLGDEQVLEPLFNSTLFQAAVQNAGVRGDNNTIFSGHFPEWRGNVFDCFRTVHDDADGPIGTPMAPVAILGEAIAGDGQSVVIKGGDGTNTDPLYFADFPGYDHVFDSVNQAAIIDPTVYYLLIVTPTGQFGFASYTGSNNNGNQITTLARIDGTNTALEGVDTLAGVWDGLITTNWPAGSMVYHANRLGALPCHSMLIGKGALCRAYGAGTEIHFDNDDYNFAQGAEFLTRYGDVAPLDRYQRTRNSVIVSSTYNPVGDSMPQVVRI